MEQNLIPQRLVSQLTSDDEGIVVPKINNDIIQDLQPKARKPKRVVSEKTKEALTLSGRGHYPIYGT